MGIGVLFVCFRVFRASNNFLCGRPFSRLTKVFVWKDCCSYYLVCGISIITFFVIDGLVSWLSFLIVKTVKSLLLTILNPRSKVLLSSAAFVLSVPIILFNMITESVYPTNPPNLQGEKRVLRAQNGI